MDYRLYNSCKKQTYPHEISSARKKLYDVLCLSLSPKSGGKTIS